MKPYHPWVYDLETYPNFFSGIFISAITGQMHVFECSTRRNDMAALWAFLWSQYHMGDVRQVGFNNLGFDYPILHEIMRVPDPAYIDYSTCYTKAQSIIKSQFGFGSSVKPWEVLTPQIDLFKIHHFDNKSKGTSLKQLQFVMRSQSIEDLPFPVGTVLTPVQMDTVLEYNFHDVAETLKFYYESRGLIAFRDKLTEKYGTNFTNFNDTKIGKQFFIDRLEKAAPGTCFDPATRKPRQTIRDTIHIGSIVLPYVQPEHAELRRVKNWMCAQTIDGTNVRGAFKHGGKEDADEVPNVIAVVNGLELKFGVGGIHGSVNNRSFFATETRRIYDIDVAGYYPDVAIQNKFRPAHLGDLFVRIYADMKEERNLFAKGTEENAVLKLANNGVYGDSGNPYSPFFDTQYMISVTVNGQLSIAMLVEQIMKTPSVEVIQVNTDGLTIAVDDEWLPHVKTVMQWWEKLTGLTLEDGFYSAMYVRDVNAYIAVDTKGKVKKRKGPFSWVHGPNLGAGELAWHQDHSALVIPMAAEAALLEGADISQYVYGHTDIFDFCLLAKARSGSVLQLADGTQLTKTLRYIVSRDGQPLQKIMPPKPGCKIGDFKRANGLPDQYFYQIENEIGGSGTWDARIHTKNKSRYDMKPTSIEAGYLVTPCNSISQAQFTSINYEYYISKAKALVAAVGQQQGDTK